MALSYEFSVGSVRAREKHLLGSADIERLLSCKSDAEVATVLSDKGYGEGKTLDQILSSNTETMWNYLDSIAPDPDIFNIFKIQNDIHNYKVVLKGTMSARKYSHLLLNSGTIEHALLIEAVENNKFSVLPDWLRDAALRAYEIITAKGDARESDAVVDKAAMIEILRLASAYNSDFIKNYFNNLVFYNNIKIALRCSKAEASRNYLDAALCEVEDFRKKSVTDAALKGHDELITELSKYSEYDCSRAIEEYKLSPSAFEKFVDNRLIILAKECCKRAGGGPEPIIGYYLGCEAERKVIHIIASGIRTGADAESIRERLREIYG